MERRYIQETFEQQVDPRVGNRGATNNFDKAWETRNKTPDVPQDYGTGYGAASQSIDIPQTQRQIGFPGDTSSKRFGSTRPPRDFPSEIASQSADRLPGSDMRRPPSYFERPIPKGNSLGKYVQGAGDYLRVVVPIQREDGTIENIDKTMQIGEDGTMQERDETTRVGKNGQWETTSTKPKRGWFW